MFQIELRKVRTLNLCVTFGLAVGSALTAQADCSYLRSRRFALTRAETVDSSSYLQVDMNFDQAQSVVKWYQDGQPQPTLLAQANLPFHRIGKALLIADRQFLLSGLEFQSWNPVSARGVLCKAEFVEQGGVYTINIVEEQVLPTFDPVSIAWSEHGGRLYLLDYKTSRILAADWAGWTSAVPGEAAYEGAASPADIALLTEAELPVLDTPRSLFRADRHSSACFFMSYADLQNHWVVDKVGANWTVNAYDAPRSMVVRYPLLVSTRDDAVLRLRSPCTGAWTLARETDGQVVASGTATLDQWTTIGGTTQEFSDEPGIRYILEATAQPSPFRKFVYPTVRYGAPQGTASFSLGRAFMPYVCCVGDGAYGNGVSTMQTIGTGTVHGSLWVGFRDGSGNDPVTVDGDVAVLSPQSTVEFQYDLTQFPSTVGLHYPIPDQQAIVGSVIFWQYVFVLPNSDLAFSEVFGTRILDHEGAGTPMTLTATRSTASTEERLEQGWQWIGATEKGELVAPKRDRVRRLRARMLKR